ncbi:hypothetical protein, partial [Paraburkholderia kururiensis]|uniref:hypothetical protein n=1 Tax=Paraburkholderia kururiensis TaxID=984307 RepID=UPI001F2F6193
MVACATASRWDAAVFLFAPGGVYGAYDAARVADATAGQAARGLRSGAMQAAMSGQPVANGGLRPDFDAAKGWDAAVAGYLRCSRNGR